MRNREKSERAEAPVSRTGKWFGPLALSLAVPLLCMGLWAQSSDESLGDVARNHKSSQKAARVVTNDEIPSAAPDPGPQANSINDNVGEKPTADASPATSKGASPKVGTKSGITVPGVLANGSPEEAKSQLEILKHDRQLLIDNYDKIERKLAETNDESLRRVYSESLARRNEAVAAKDKQIADVENALRAAGGGDTQGGKE